MKHIIVTAIIICSAILKVFSSEYEEKMGATIQKMYQSRSETELTEIAGQFEKIAPNSESEWLPGYYAAYSYLSIVINNYNISNDKKIEILDKSQKHIENIMKIKPDESEIYALQAFVYLMSIIKPEEGYKYSTLANENLTKAEKLNPNNPRIYYLTALSYLYTPEDFGGGAEVAKPLFEKAEQLFKDESGKDKLLPSWGKYHNGMMLQQCEGKK
ncbi:MAG: hypothetical protein KA807_02145 [Prolixibacteraceae bacterium]|nr:hypothetical protein [Prolixibacteraceae bacterium]